jgi:hypothetical protein
MHKIFEDLDPPSVFTVRGPLLASYHHNAHSLLIIFAPLNVLFELSFLFDSLETLLYF